MPQRGNQFGKSEEQTSNQCGENTVEKGRGEWCEVHSEGKQDSDYMEFWKSGENVKCKTHVMEGCTRIFKEDEHDEIFTSYI